MNTTITAGPATQQTCGFTGKADYYGVGIRAGFYCSWFTQFLETLFIPGEAGFFRSVNIITQAALFIALLVLTQQKDVYQVESLIFFWLMFGALSSLTRRGLNPLKSLHGWCRLVLYTGVAAFAVWFWVRGMDGQDRTPCGTVAFFGHVGIDGPFRIFSKVAVSCALALCGGLFVYMPWLALRSPSITRRATGDEGQPVWYLTLLSLSIIAVSITAIEYLIEANGITAVDKVQGAGQLLPLLVGSYGLAKAIGMSVGAFAGWTD